MRIGQLIRQAKSPFFSFEFFPPSQPEQMPEFYATADRLGSLNPLFVSVTYGAGGAKQQNTLNVTSSFAKRGMTVMAHLTCVGAQPEPISQFVQALLQNGVENVLALRGDPPKGQPWSWDGAPFHYAEDLIRFIKTNFPQMGIGAAAYPAPHPESPTFAEDRVNTAKKLAAGAEFAITQLFFDVREYIDLLSTLRQNGVNIPVVPGILPIQSLEALKRVLSLCGANIPGKLYLDLEQANQQGGAEAVREAGLKFAATQIKRLLDMGAPGIHLYTLNRSALCERLLEDSGLLKARQ